MQTQERLWVRLPDLPVWVNKPYPGAPQAQLEELDGQLKRALQWTKKPWSQVTSNPFYPTALAYAPTRPSA